MYRLPDNGRWPSGPPRISSGSSIASKASVRKCPGGDGCKKTLSLAAILVHLNDDHRWSREQIAGWLDGLK